MRGRGIILGIVVLLIVAAGLAWKLFNPGPMAFGADRRSRFRIITPSIRRAFLPISKMRMWSSAANISRAPPIASHVTRCRAIGFLPADSLCPCRSERFIPRISHQTRTLGSAITPIRISLMPCNAEVLAIKAYLFSVPAVHAENLPNTLSFPFNQRWLMTFWSAFFNENARFRPNTAQSAEWNRGAYVAEALAHCGECHTPRNFALALDNRNKFSGAVFGWYAFNITSDKESGIGAWSDDELRNYLSTGHASGRGTAAGPMGEAVDKSFSKMAPADIGALVTYLRSVPAIASADLPTRLAPPAPASPKQGNATAEAVGKRVFEGACVHCHDWTGVSQISPFATIAGARGVNDRTATNVVQIVISGTRRGHIDGVVSMPAFGSAYSDSEIAAVANYVTARFGSAPSKLTDKDVAELRSQAAD